MSAVRSTAPAVLPQLLPHGAGMLLVDRVESLIPGRCLVAAHTVRADEPCFAAGADDGRLRYPPTLLLESMGQAAALLWMASTAYQHEQVPMLATVRGFRLLGPVFAGDVVRHRVRLEHCGQQSAMASATTEVDGVRVAEVESLLAVGRRPAELPAASAAPGEVASPPTKEKRA